jgi:hypothetical protein
MRADRPQQVYWTTDDAQGTWLSWSDDGGGAIKTAPRSKTLSLLHAEGHGSGRLWASARDDQTVGNRGLAILRADDPQGPWQTMLRVNYFGGFVVDPEGVIWVGDEIGSLYRSHDGGESFENLAHETDVACLAYGGSALWACSPAAPQDPVLYVLRGEGAPLAKAVALAEVDQLVACPGTDVTRACGNAWVEWQRDVLMRPLESTPLPMPADVDAGPAPVASSGADCGVHARASAPVSALLLAMLALGMRLVRRRRSPAATPHATSQESAP